jgi:hypothetical protein
MRPVIQGKASDPARLRCPQTGVFPMSICVVEWGRPLCPARHPTPDTDSTAGKRDDVLEADLDADAVADGGRGPGGLRGVQTAAIR